MGTSARQVPPRAARAASRAPGRNRSRSTQSGSSNALPAVSRGNSRSISRRAKAEMGVDALSPPVHAPLQGAQAGEHHAFARRRRTAATAGRIGWQREAASRHDLLCQGGANGADPPRTRARSGTKGPEELNRLVSVDRVQRPLAYHRFRDPARGGQVEEEVARVG